VNPFRKSGSISVKLTRMNFMVTATALLLACASFFAYDLYSFRKTLVTSLATEAQIIGANSVSAITFDDPQAAAGTLSALKSSPHVLSGEILTNSGEVFATYIRSGSSPGPVVQRLPPDETTASWVDRRNIVLGSRIDFHGQSVGTVYIMAETTEVFRHARNYGLISAVILFLCLLSALLVTSNIRRLLAGPLIGLAETARIVTNRRDYSIRASGTDQVDEVSVLVHSFNEMLGQIEQRDKALEDAKEVLEQRVLERTAELSAANEELEAFSYSVAHDLRGPLDIIGNIGFLLEQSTGSADDALNHSLVADLLQGTGKMSALISDLLNLSRAGRVGLHKVPIDLSNLASGVAAELQASEPNRKVSFNIVPGAKVMGDENLLCIVMENLVRNAWKYTSKVDAAEITFGCIERKTGSIYFIRDNGAGFDPQLAERLFKPFQRLHTESEFPGTGVGLATVQRIIARHGGRIWAEAKVNHGATFFFTLGRNVAAAAYEPGSGPVN
jgi:signal transduction histidine kinase